MGSTLHRSLRFSAVIAVAAGVCAASACRRGPAVAPHAAQADLRARIESVLRQKATPRFVVRSAAGRRLWNGTREFYQKRQFAPVWLQGKGSQHQIDELLAALQHADRDALDPARYRATEVARLRDDLARAASDARAHDAAALDARLTYLYLQYATDVTTGVTDSRERWHMKPDAFDAVASLEDALTRDGIDASLADLPQRNPEYAALRKALQRYRDIAARGGWPMLPANTRLKPGDRGPAVPLLARRLSVTGDYVLPEGAAPAAYDEGLQDAVKRFERRHGLTADGIVGRGVVQELNVPAAARVRQIALNMERARWVPTERTRHIVVNVPEYRLEVRDGSQVPLAMRVVVGRKDAQTPAFSGEMSYIVLAPFWNVPADIAEKETLPALASDPEYLDRTNMEIVDKRGRPVDPEEVDLGDAGKYRFRQRPGASNSLGLVKFMFRNPYNVYLHDTPADALFARDVRTFSHGCVRLEKPEQLADYVLGDQPEWTPDRIREAMHGTEQTTVRLKQKLPVYITYFTARAGANGEVDFFRDIYGRDAGG